MCVCLVRHGKAFSKEENPERPLTEEGKAESQKVAAFLKGMDLNVSRIFHSGKKRAEETAVIMQQKISKGCEIAVHDNLSPNDPVDPIIDEIEQANDVLMIVGHLPYLHKLATKLVTGQESPSILQLKESAVVILDKDDQEGWMARTLISPDLLS